MSEVMETKEGSRADSSLFVLPRTLDEILVTAVFVAWPLIFMFVLMPNMDLNVAGEVVAWLTAFAIQVGIAYGLRTARRRGR
jgi:hypothetical protein